jgi:CheY-like chemotaxis protein
VGHELRRAEDDMPSLGPEALEGRLEERAEQRVEDEVEAVASRGTDRAVELGAKAAAIADDDRLRARARSRTRRSRFAGSPPVAIGARRRSQGSRAPEARRRPPRSARGLEEFPERIHLLLSDVVMPHLGGTELARLFRDRHPGPAVILMSGYSDEAVRREGALDAAGAFLQKPYQMPDLAQTLRRLLHEGRGRRRRRWRCIDADRGVSGVAASGARG